MNTEEKHMSFKKHLLVGATIGIIISLYKVSDSTAMWEGDGTPYNIARIGGGIVGGMVWGAIIFWIRNRVSKGHPQ